jgi:hypothetical protein
MPAPPAVDMVHTPPAEQVVLTAVPIYVELPPGVTASKVVVAYKAFGASDWQTAELRKLGRGYGGEIPCHAVGGNTGDLWYYVRATDSSGETVAQSGSRKAPHKVPIQNQLTGEPPHLPGRPPSKKCGDTADCPPGLPGCPSAGGESAKTCETSSDCGTGQTCSDEKVCEGSAAASPRKRLWVSANIQQDFSLIKAVDVCGSPDKNQPDNIDCIAPDGFPYAGVAEAADPAAGTGNQISASPRRSMLRLLLDVSYLVSTNFSVGLRGGYVLNAAPGHQKAKFHGELRVAYWFGGDPFAKSAIRPYVAVMGGLAESDDKVNVQVYETLCTTDAECGTMANRALGLSPNPTLTVWRHSGGTFAGGAAGVMIPTTASQGVLVELKGQAFFPFATYTMSPSVGYAVGF